MEKISSNIFNYFVTNEINKRRSRSNNRVSGLNQTGFLKQCMSCSLNKQNNYKIRNNYLEK